MSGPIRVGALVALLAGSSAVIAGNATAIPLASAPAVALARPGSVRIVHPLPGNHGLALRWASSAADRYRIEQATNAAMTKHAHSYTLDGSAAQFTPYGLADGTRYFFRVRSLHGSSQSPWSKVVSAGSDVRTANYTVLTWNVLHKKFDGTKENGNTIAPWDTKRLPIVASMIKQAHPDLISINEASDPDPAKSWHGTHARRQIDSILAKLTGYALADPDFTIDNTHPLTGNYLLYRTSMFAPVGLTHGRAHYWILSKSDNESKAAYQIVRDKRTGARFLVVVLHLQHGPNAKRYDAARAKEARLLLADVQRKQRSDPAYAHLPILYAGDTNSYAGNGSNAANLDTPGDLLRKSGATEALVAAQHRTNTKYSSVNGYTRAPSKSGRIIDHFYGTGGIAFRTWTQKLRLVHGHWPGAIPSDHNPVVAGISVQYVPAHAAAAAAAARSHAMPARAKPSRGAREIAVPAAGRAVDTAHPDRYVGHGTAASCTSAAVLKAVRLGGVIRFRCGPKPMTITLKQTAKVVNTSKRVVLDGQNRITLSGAGKRRILYLDTCDPRQVWTTSHCQNQARPHLVVQNLRFVHGNSTGHDYDGGGGGAIFDRGGQLKIVHSVFENNRCERTGPDIGGAAVRVLSQYDTKPVYVVQSTFEHNRSSNGAGLSSIGVSWAVYDSTFEHNRATGHGANPARKHTPGGGSGAAIYTDGDTYDVTVKGTVMRDNIANEGGGAIFYVSNDRSGKLSIAWSTLHGNPSRGFETQPGIFFLGKTAKPRIRHSIDN